MKKKKQDTTEFKPLVDDAVWMADHAPGGEAAIYKEDVYSAVMGLWEASGRMAPVRTWFPVFFEKEKERED